MSTIAIGVDEAGRGAWAGPVVAGACAIINPRFKKTEIYAKINDSKQLSKLQRNRVFEELLQARNRGDLCFYVTAIDSETIDAVGIKEANRLAMESSIVEVLKMLESSKGKTTTFKEIHIDGNDHYTFELFEYEKNEKIKIQEHIRGDQLFKIIGAASILAKVTRDTWMESLKINYPEYGFEKHKGYGTALHRTALSEFGILKIHRKSYSPIKHLILQAKKL